MMEPLVLLLTLVLFLVLQVNMSAVKRTYRKNLGGLVEGINAVEADRTSLHSKHFMCLTVVQRM